MTAAFAALQRHQLNGMLSAVIIPCGLLVPVGHAVADASLNLEAFSEGHCTTDSHDYFKIITLPTAIFPFKFSPNNGVTRSKFTFALVCSDRPDADAYIKIAQQTTNGAKPVHDDDFDIYRRGILEKLYVNSNNRVIFYFCEFMGCHQYFRLIPCDAHLVALHATFGIELENRDKIPQIDSVILSVVQGLSDSERSGRLGPLPPILQ